MSSLEHFFDWCSKEPHITALCPVDDDFKRTDTLCAIAQHFGLANDRFWTSLQIRRSLPSLPQVITTRMPKLAALYASKRLPFEAHAKTTDPTGKKLALIEVHVPDLWRLHAQKGVFVYCDGPFEDYSYIQLAWIVFPPSKTLVGSRSVESIYPPEKSHLEILLDQYTQKETDEEAQEQFKVEFARLGRSLSRRGVDQIRRLRSDKSL